MAADVYRRLTTVEIIKNRSVRRYCEMSRVQEKKAHFNRCLTVLGTTKTTYKAIYFVQNYVLKCKLLKAIWGR